MNRKIASALMALPIVVVALAGCDYGPKAPVDPPVYGGGNTTTPEPPIACADSSSLVHITSEIEGFNFADTKAKGHYKFNEAGLKINTDDASSDAKVAAHLTLTNPVLLSDIVARSQDPSLKYNNVAGGIPGMNLRVVKADGTAAGTLVGEPGVYGVKWWSNTAYGVGTDFGYTSADTLDAYSAANPKMMVTSVGFTLGSGVKGEGTVKSLEFNGVTYRFGTEC